MLAIRLDQNIEQRLTYLADTTGRSKSYYVREAIEGYIDDLEDAYLAESALEKLKLGRSSTQSLDEVEAELGLAD